MTTWTATEPTFITHWPAKDLIGRIGSRCRTRSEASSTVYKRYFSVHSSFSVCLNVRLIQYSITHCAVTTILQYLEQDTIVDISSLSPRRPCLLPLYLCHWLHRILARPISANVISSVLLTGLKPVEACAQLEASH